MAGKGFMEKPSAMSLGEWITLWGEIFWYSLNKGLELEM